MLSLTFRSSGRGFFYASTDHDGPLSNPAFVERGIQKTVRVPANGSSLSISAYEEQTEPDGRKTYLHCGAAVIDLKKINVGPITLGINHRGLVADGITIELVDLEGDLTIYRQPQTDYKLIQLAAISQYDVEENGSNSALADALRAPVYQPPTSSEPLIFGGYLHGGRKVPYTVKYLKHLFTLAVARLGHTYDEAQEVCRQGLENPVSHRGSQEIIWVAITALANAFKYKADSWKTGDGQQIPIESFDDSLRRCIDCEDATRMMHQLAREYESCDELEFFCQLLKEYEIMSILASVTQPSAGTNVLGGEDERTYGGHLFAAAVPKKSFSKGRTDGIVILEGTGIMYGIPFMSESVHSKIQAKIARNKYVIEASGGSLENAPHLFSSESSIPGYMSSFYRRIHEVHWGYENRTRGATVADKQFLKREVTFEDFLNSNFKLIEYVSNTPKVWEETEKALSLSIPEPSPFFDDADIPDAPSTIPKKGVTAIFYIAEDMTRPSLPIINGEKPNIQKEQMTDYFFQWRVSYTFE